MCIDGLRRERNLEDRLASVERDLVDEVRWGGAEEGLRYRKDTYVVDK